MDRYLAFERVDACVEREEDAGPCPACGHTGSLPIWSGEPTRVLERMAQRREVALGGCVVWPEKPTRACAECRHEWRPDAAASAWIAALPGSVLARRREQIVVEWGFAAGPAFAAAHVESRDPPSPLGEALAAIASRLGQFKRAHVRLVDGTRLVFEPAGLISPPR